MRQRFSAQHSGVVAALFISGSYLVVLVFRDRVQSSPKLIFAAGALASVWSVLVLSAYNALKTAVRGPFDERHRPKPLGWFAALFSGTVGGLLGFQIHPVCLTVSWLLYAVWLWGLQTPTT